MEWDWLMRLVQAGPHPETVSPEVLCILLFLAIFAAYWIRTALKTKELDQ